jgi:hypothetical protein
MTSPTLELDVQTYSPFFKEDKEDPITEIAHVTGILARLDGGVTANNEAPMGITDD